MEEYLIGEILKILGEAFPGLPVFTEEVKQGYPLPCLFLLCRGCRVEQEMGRRFRAEGEFLLRAGPEEKDALAGARWLDRLEAAFRGKKGFSFSLGETSAEDGVSQGILRGSVVGFWTEKAPPTMKKMGLRLELGGAERQG